MVGLRGVLDPEGAAILKSAIDPLSIPCPEKDEQGRTVTPDDRTPARRRMDALLAIVQRGVASADGVPTTDKAKVVVLIDLDDLLADLNGDIPEAFRRKGSSGRSAWRAGPRTTLTGDVLSPGVVRRMACDAEIIPMVLGGDSEPLDVGRRRRLFTRGQRLALIARDKGCSWAGCTVPASWCDAHHVVHWRHGGRTSLLNGGPVVPEAPHRGPRPRPHGDGHRSRRHLAHLRSPPHTPPAPAGSVACREWPVETSATGVIPVSRR